jgi:hypothetical protein
VEYKQIRRRIETALSPGTQGWEAALGTRLSKMGTQKLQQKPPRDPFGKVFIMILLSGKCFAKNSKQKLWLFVLYLFDPKFLKMAPGTLNVATNQINRSHCADRTRW